MTSMRGVKQGVSQITKYAFLKFTPLLEGLENDHCQAQDSEDIPESTDKGFRDSILHHVHIVSDAGHEHSGRSFSEEGQGHTVHMFVEFIPDVLDHTESCPAHYIGPDIPEYALEYVDGNDHRRDKKEHLAIASYEYVVQNVLDNQRRHRGHGSHADHSEGRDDQLAFIGADIAKKPEIYPKGVAHLSAPETISRVF